MTNRSALSEIGYRHGTWREFLDTMLAELAGTGGALPGLRTRDPADPTIALLDAWAVACDVLTFYTERLAQESFLRTALEPDSLRELGRLIGYRPDPGVAAETQLAFTLERPPTVAAPSADPGLAPPTTPAEVTLPAGLRVQSIPGPGERPQTFETVAELVARPEWSSLPVAQTVERRPAAGHRSVWLRGTGLNLAPGAALLIAGRTARDDDFVHDRWDFRLVSEVAVDHDLGSTRVELEWPLGSRRPWNDPNEDPAAFVLRKRLQVFGHNAPLWPTLDESYRRGYAKTIVPDDAVTPPREIERAREELVNADDWYRFWSYVGLEGGDLVIDVDGAHLDVVPGSWVVVSQEGIGFQRELFAVVERRVFSRAGFGISGTVTRLRLHGEDPEPDLESPRYITLFALSEAVDLAQRPDESEVAGGAVLVDGDATAMAPGRTICVSSPTRPGHAEVAVVRAVEAAGTSSSGGPRTRITLAADLVDAYDRSTTVVLGNVVTATHGETVHEVLGSGDARRAFQRFSLAQGPLTFAQAPTAEGSASTLRVSVDGVTWPAVRSHYGAGPGDRTVTHARSAEPNPATGSAFDIVEFGDGLHGARTSTGSHNVRATYRRGLGAVGNLAANRLAQPLDRPLGLKAATNPVPATGGADPEGPESARRTMPVSVRTLGRAVSLRDYADFSLAFAGVSRADARVLALRSGRTVVVSVCGPDATEAAPTTMAHLRTALHELGDPLVQVEVVPAVLAPFRLALALEVDPLYDEPLVRQAVADALHAELDFAAGELGRPVAASAVIACAARVPGVVSVDLNRLHRVGAGAPPLSPRIFAAPATVTPDGTPVGAELLGLAADRPFEDSEGLS